MVAAHQRTTQRPWVELPRENHRLLQSARGALQTARLAISGGGPWTHTAAAAAVV